MRCLMIVGVLLTLTTVAASTSGAKPPATSHPDEGPDCSAKTPMLKMVYIRASSPGALKQLRSMPIDIIKVRPDPRDPIEKKSLTGSVIVEAVVPIQILPKLKAKGFEILEDSTIYE